MEAKNMGLMSETDDLVKKYYSGEITYGEVIHELWPQACEMNDRWWKILGTGYHYYEFTEITSSWLKQWCNNPDYNQYNASDVELLAKGTGLFLIPKEDRKPIKLIIA